MTSEPHDKTMSLISRMKLRTRLAILTSGLVLAIGVAIVFYVQIRVFQARTPIRMRGQSVGERLPLVRTGCLYGAYYARKTQVEHMAGPKAMMAVSRKILKLLWGWYHSGRGFDASRVFHCRALHAAAA